MIAPVQPEVGAVTEVDAECSFNAADAVAFAQENAVATSIGRCARYVMAAVARGFHAIAATDDPGTLMASSSVAKIEKELGISPGSPVPTSAKSYGTVLEHLGFQAEKTVAAKSSVKEDFAFETGDIIIIQSTTVNAHGHIQIYDGTQWISDFKQKDPLWPHSSPKSEWQVEKPAYVIYRFSTD